MVYVKKLRNCLNVLKLCGENCRSRPFFRAQCSKMFCAVLDVCLSRLTQYCINITPLGLAVLQVRVDMSDISKKRQ